MRNEWETRTLTNCLLKVIDYRGKTPKKLGGDWTSSGYRALSANNVKFNGLDKLNSIKYIDETLYKKWMQEEVQKGDLLLTSEAPSGQIMLWDSDEKIVLSQRLFALRVNDHIDNKFLKYYIQSPIGQKEIIRNNSGSTVGGISAKTFSNILIRHPKIDLQKKIGDLLYSLDKKIELNNKINAKLEAIARLIYDYWFVLFDFPDVNGKPYKSSGGKMVYNEELKQEIPVSWDSYSLSSILKCNYSSMKNKDLFEDIEYLDTGSLTKNFVEYISHIQASKHSVPSRAKRIVHKNDILYSTVRPNLCHYGIIKSPLNNMVASTGFAQLASKLDWISNDLIYTFLTSKWVTEKLHQIAVLAVSAYPSISPSDILGLKIALPREKTQVESINKILDKIYSKISILQKENHKLSRLRDWLLPMLMSGQIKLK